MTKFNIYFHGLICFYAPEARRGNQEALKTMLLFVDDPDHLRTVITYPDHRNFDNFSSLKFVVDPEVTRYIRTTRRFRAEVPHLGDDSVTNPGFTVYPNMAIAVDLPNVEGKLSVAQRYKHEGIYKLAGDHQHPVARISRLTFEASSLSVEYGGNMVEVPPYEPWVAILNVSPRPDAVASPPSAHSCGNHFQRYSKIMQYNNQNAECDDVAVVDDDANTNPAERLKGKHSKKVKALKELNYTGVLNQTQCSNSNWP